mgnify:CR=1 FL=1
MTHINGDLIIYDAGDLLTLSGLEAIERVNGNDNNHIKPLDRLESIHRSKINQTNKIIEISGYSTEEKIEIAKRHLIPEQLAEHGLTSKHVKLNARIY